VAVEGIQNDIPSVAYTVPGRNAQTFTVTNEAYRWNPLITYTWMPGTYLNSVNIKNPIASNMQNSITYTVITQAANGCTLSAVKSISVNPSPTLSISGGAVPVCPGNSVGLVASGANSYTWTGGPVSASMVVSPTVTSTYTVTGTSNNCNGSAVQTVTVYPQPTVNISGPSSICFGQSTTYTASGADTYTWSNALLTSTVFLSPTVTTVYSVSGTSSLTSCTATAIQTLNVYPNPTVSVAGSTLLCSGQNATLSAGGANTFSWSNGGNTATIFPTPSVSTNYSVTGTNSLGGCTGTAMISVSVNPSPTLSASGSTIICAGQTANLGAAGADTYSWSNGANTASTSVTPSVSSTFTVTGTSTLNGCSANAVQNVTVVPVPTVSISGPSAICPGATASFTANGAGTYSWSNGSTLSTISDSPLNNTSYSVIGVSGPGCSGSASISLTVNPVPGLTLNVVPSQTICAGESLTLNAVSGADTFSWSNGGNGSSISDTPSASTVYSVQASISSTGCFTTQAISIVVDPCIGLPERNNDLKLKIYPNPFSGIFYIESLNSNQPEFEIRDVSGRIISSGKLMKGNNRIDMSTYAKGMYYLRFSGESMSVYKIIRD
jgi:hypothetical protein